VQGAFIEVQDPLPFWSIFKRDQRVLETGNRVPSLILDKVISPIAAGGD
jgi:hypothetical protein